jgi:hypothetical protein
VDEDHAPAGEALRAPGNGAAVIAIAGTGDRDVLGHITVATVGGPRCASALANTHATPYAAARRLEAAEAKTGRFVLQPDRSQTCPLGKGRQIAQRRHLIAVPRSDLRLGTLETCIRK